MKKAHRRLHFLRRLKRAHLSPSLLTTFYRGTTESGLTSSISLRHDSSGASDEKAPGRAAGQLKTLVGPNCHLADLAEQRCRSRAARIARDPARPCYTLFSLVPSGSRYRSLPSRTGRLRDSFYPPAASGLLNPGLCTSVFKSNCCTYSLH